MPAAVTGGDVPGLAGGDRVKGGHIGFSEGFNFNLYKPFLPSAHPNSQGREQMHSKLDKLCPSLKQINYEDFMSFLRLFLVLPN